MQDEASIPDPSPSGPIWVVAAGVIDVCAWIDAIVIDHGVVAWLVAVGFAYATVRSSLEVRTLRRDARRRAAGLPSLLGD